MNHSTALVEHLDNCFRQISDALDDHKGEHSDHSSAFGDDQSVCVGTTLLARFDNGQKKACDVRIHAFFDLSRNRQTLIFERSGQAPQTRHVYQGTRASRIDVLGYLVGVKDEYFLDPRSVTPNELSVSLSDPRNPTYVILTSQDDASQDLLGKEAYPDIASLMYHENIATASSTFG